MFSVMSVCHSVYGGGGPLPTLSLAPSRHGTCGPVLVNEYLIFSTWYLFLVLSAIFISKYSFNIHLLISSRPLDVFFASVNEIYSNLMVFRCKTLLHVIILICDVHLCGILGNFSTIFTSRNEVGPR